MKTPESTAETTTSAAAEAPGVATPMTAELAASITRKALEPDLDTPTVPNDLPPAGGVLGTSGVRASGVAKATGRILAKALPMIGALCGGLALWYAVTYLVLAEDRRFLLPSPHQVLMNSALDVAKVQPMLEALALTARVAMTGLAIAIVLGVSAAILMSQGKWVEKTLYPYAVILQTVPILALVPLIGLWFGFGFTSRVIVCVIIALFPMISNTLFGIQSAHNAAHDLFTLNRATNAQRLWKLQIPAAIPSIFAGLKISSGLAVIGAIVGDMFFRQGKPGIGGLLDTYRARVESENLLTAIGLACLLGVVVFAIFTALDRMVLKKWYGISR